MQQPTPLVERAVLDMAIRSLGVAGIGEMGEFNGDVRELDRLRVMQDRGKTSLEIPVIPMSAFAGAVTYPTAIMIARYEHLGAVKETNKAERIGKLTHGDITQDDHDVIRRDSGVPAFDQRQVHLIGSTERAVAIADHIRVRKMKIGAEPQTRHVPIVL